MPAGLLIRLRPTGPWRIGPDSGDRDRVDRIYHSDSLYSAVCGAMLRLGTLEEWLDATARADEPAVRFSSCFPFQEDTLFVVPPRSHWPPPASAKVRWKGAQFVPLSLVESLVAGQPIGEDKWLIDGASECLVPSSASQVSGPFRAAVRSNAAVDRGGRGVAPHSTACLEFTPGSGLWLLAGFSNDAAREKWRQPLEAAFRLLADSGFGGERSNGWGHSEMPEISVVNIGMNSGNGRHGRRTSLISPFRASSFQASSFPASGAEDSAEIASTASSENGGASETGYWMLSLFHPAQSDPVDWQRGNYVVTTRNGRVESPAGSGDAKKPTRMVSEGSVIVASREPRGAATDVAPEAFPHPVYRAGFALAVPITLNGNVRTAS